MPEYTDEYVTHFITEVFADSYIKLDDAQLNTIIQRESNSLLVDFLNCLNRNVSVINVSVFMGHIITYFERLSDCSKQVFRPIVIAKIDDFIIKQDAIDYKDYKIYDLCILAMDYAKFLFYDKASNINERYQSIISVFESSHITKPFIFNTPDPQYLQVDTLKLLKSIIEDLDQQIQEYGADSNFLGDISYRTIQMLVDSIGYLIYIRIEQALSSYDYIKNQWDYRYRKKDFNTYGKIRQIYQKIYEMLSTHILEDQVQDFLRESSSNDLRDQIRHIGGLFSEHFGTVNCTISEYIEKQFPSFLSKLNNIDDLLLAYHHHLISEDFLLAKIQVITYGAEVSKLEDAIRDQRSEDTLLPPSVQVYFSKLIIDRWRKNSFDGDINPKSLCGWIQFNKSNEDDYLQVVQSLTKYISKKNLWDLYINGWLNTPGMENIRSCLDTLYRKNQMQMYVHDDCFQKVMVEDAKKAMSKRNYRILFLIMNNLLDKELEEVISTNREFLCLLVWIGSASGLVDKNIVEKCFQHNQQSDRDILHMVDWNLIENHLFQLSLEYQIRVINYLFYLKSCGFEDFSVADLRRHFLFKGKHDLYAALKIVLYLLDCKSQNLQGAINEKDLVSLILSHCVPGDAALTDNYNQLITGLEMYFPKCTGYTKFLNPDSPGWYYTHPFDYGTVTDWDQSFFAITFSEPAGYLEDDYMEEGFNVIHDENHDQEFNHTLFELKAIIRASFPIQIINQEIYLIPKTSVTELKKLVIKYGLKDNANLFKTIANQAIDEYSITKYAEPNCIFCKRDKMSWTEDAATKIPYSLCGSKICMNFEQFLTAKDDWSKYTFVDLLYALYNRDSGIYNTLWSVASEIAGTLNHLIKEVYKIEQTDVENSIEQNDSIVVDDGVGIIEDQSLQPLTIEDCKDLSIEAWDIDSESLASDYSINYNVKRDSYEYRSFLGFGDD
jgi:hypothetical protein